MDLLQNLKEAKESELVEVLNELTSNIKDIDHDAVNEMEKRLDAKIKPTKSLGNLENIARQVSGIMGTAYPQIKDKAVLLMAGDHGVVEDGVSAAPQEVTTQMFYSFLNGKGGINILANHAGARVVATDIGIAGPLNPPELMENRVKDGTNNISKGPAMTNTEALQALLTGAKIAKETIDSGVNLLATGEVGIGNTTPSSALLSVFTGHSVEEVTDGGTGLKADALIRKQDVIKKAIEVNQPNPDDPIGTLAKLGGLEIAALTGAILEAARQGVPVILDGIISTAAALTAVKIAPLTRHYLISSHNSEEKGHRIGLRQLGMEPNLYMHMRLGEGTGAALMFPMVEAAIKVADQMATFEDAGVTTGDF